MALASHDAIRRDRAHLPTTYSLYCREEKFSETQKFVGGHEKGAEVVPRPLLYKLLLTVSLTLHRTLSSYLRCSVVCCTIVAHISKKSCMGVCLYSLSCLEEVFSGT